MPYTIFLGPNITITENLANFGTARLTSLSSPSDSTDLATVEFTKNLVNVQASRIDTILAGTSVTLNTLQEVIDFFNALIAKPKIFKIAPLSDALLSSPGLPLPFSFPSVIPPGISGVDGWYSETPCAWSFFCPTPASIISVYFFISNTGSPSSSPSLAFDGVNVYSSPETLGPTGTYCCWALSPPSNIRALQSAFGVIQLTIPNTAGPTGPLPSSLSSIVFIAPSPAAFILSSVVFETAVATFTLGLSNDSVKLHRTEQRLDSLYQYFFRTSS